MVRLADSLAAVRRLYRRPVATMPDILVVEIAPAHRRPSLSLGRFLWRPARTEAEHREFEEFLTTERLVLIAPSLLDRRASALSTGRITIARYVLPEPGWPWVLLCHWPGAYTREAPIEDDLFARGAYTIEMYADETRATFGAELLLASLGAGRDLLVTEIAGAAEYVTGRA